MATIIETVGAANANSYATVAEATAYNESRTYASSWADADVADQIAALIDAARRLDSSFRWTGAAVDDVQALCWPRSGMLSRNGFTIGTAVIPQQLKDAQCELARQLLDADRFADSDAEKQGLKRLKAGPVELEFKDSSSSSNSIALRDADVTRMGPEFEYLSRGIPDAVRNLLPPSWYETATVSRPIFFEAN